MRRETKRCPIRRTEPKTGAGTSSDSDRGALIGCCHLHFRIPRHLRTESALESLAVAHRIRGCRFQSRRRHNVALEAAPANDRMNTPVLQSNLVAAWTGILLGFASGM